MAITPEKFTQLFERLVTIDLFGSGPPEVPWGDAPPRADDVLSAIDAVATRLPLVYEEAYIAPLERNVRHVLRGADPVGIETVAGAIYDHGVEDIDAELDRFLAVISNLYRSFLSATRRAAAGFPRLGEQLPPLAMFQHDGREGPFTIPVDQVASLFGGTVGVVSLPSTYRGHPLLWASLAHETGGHDVLHADAGLLPELGEGIRSFFGGGPLPSSGTLTVSQFLGALWSYWMDEAASDVYGVMNIGPAFGLNLVAFFAALGARAQPDGHPALRTFSASDERGFLDPHPTDILRPHLILGATEALRGLSASRRDAYAQDLLTLAQITGGGAQEVQIQGGILIQPGVGVSVNTSLPMDLMATAAQRVGSFIATAALAALDGKGIQDLETWDDPDEDTAVGIAQNLVQDLSVASQGDDAALLAGATVAAFQEPGSYDTITRRLNQALDVSFATDPFWGIPQVDRAYVHTRLFPEDAPELRGYVTVATP